MWALFGVVILFYAPLYMDGMGLSKVEMGIINSASLFSAFFFHLIASPISNKLGRKKTLFIFDTISWSIPMFLWAVSQNFWYFLAAAVVNSSVKIVSVSWSCLLTEDVEESQRTKIFGTIQVVSAIPGLLIFLVGLVINHFSVVPVMRILYFVGFVDMTICFILRNHYVSETRAGLALMEKHKELSLIQSTGEYLKTISGVYKNKGFIMIASIYIITFFIQSVNFFQVLYIKEHLGFNEAALSLVPAVNAVINTILYLLVTRRPAKATPEKTLALSLSVCASGTLLLLIIPGGNLLLLILTMAILAVGNYLTSTNRDAIFMNRLGDHEKGDMLAAVQTLTTLFSIPSGYIAGLAYSLSPVIPFVGIFVLFMVAGFISILMLKKRQEEALLKMPNPLMQCTDQYK
jgi:Na+/melibiose symporter-like transporter